MPRRRIASRRQVAPRRLRRPRRPAVEQNIRQQAEAAIRRHLSGLKKPELVEFLIDSAKRNAELWETLVAECRFEPTFDSADELIEAARLAISQATQIGLEWDADYDLVRQRFKKLLEAGHAAAVLELGAELYRRGEQQVELSDEGLMADDLDECLTVVFSALPRSGLSPVEQMTWAWDLVGEDGYGICLKTNERFWRRAFKPADWSGFADVLRKRLAAFDAATAEALAKQPRRRRDWPSYEDSGRKYERERLVRKLNAALEAAGRGEERIGDEG